MNNIYKLIVHLLLIALSANNVSAEEKITVVIYENVLKKYELFLAEKDSSPLDVQNFSSNHSNRVIASLILLQQALHLGGGNYTIEFISAPNPSRALSFVKSGRAVLLGDDIWDNNFDDSVYKSSEIIGPGEFEKIIVGRLDNTLLTQVKDFNDLQKLSAVTGHNWRVDIQTLEEMKISNVSEVSVYALQLKMLTAGRIDFAMLEATQLEDKKKTTLQQVNLGVVPGIKIGLAGSRHYMISKKYPQGKQLYEHLEKGLKILRQRGAIKKALIEVGFYNEKISDWQKIFQPR